MNEKIIYTKRKDKKGRILHTGEFQLADGRYRFKYVDVDGKEKFAYSNRLDHSDATPPGKKRMLSLREMEKQIQADLFDHIVSNGGNMTVIELVRKYIDTKVGVRESTKAGYGTVLNLLAKEPFGKKRIDKVRISDAKLWLIKLQQQDKKSYSSIHTIRGVLRPAFQQAVDDDYIRKNPFSFQLVDVVVNDSVRREAISREEERKFLKFVQEDQHFKRYYEGMYILFKTGMRVSEFCGLTIHSIDFKEHTITIDHQLQKRGGVGYYIDEPKTESGIRVIPMNRDVEDCFRKIIRNRKPPKVEPMIEGYSGFLYFDKDGSVMYALHWENYFRHAVDKYNSIYVEKLPKITPHICRHTYCSNMAKAGMNPKTLQYLMGHADIGVTLNTYTHVNLEDAKEEVRRLRSV